MSPLLLSSCAFIIYSAPETSSTIYLPSEISVQALYTGGSNWNDYVTASNTSQACAGAMGTDCYHAGEARKVVLTGLSSCHGLRYYDALDAFDWECEVSAGTVLIRSYRLKTGKGLSDLVTATGFRSNQVVVTYGRESVASEYGVWWSNPVVNISDFDNTAGVTGRDAGGSAANDVYSLSSGAGVGTIYVVSSNLSTTGIYFSNDKTALVTLPGYSLSATAPGANNCAGDSTKCFLMVSSKKYIWIEGKYLLSSVPFGASFISLYHSRLQNLTLQGWVNIPLVFDYSNNNWIKNLKISDFAQQGFYFYGNYNRADGIQISDSGGAWYGILPTSGKNNYFQNVRMSSLQGYGIHTSSSVWDNVWANVLINNTSLNGLRMDTNSKSNVVIGATIVGSADTGIKIDTTSHNNTLVNTIIGSNSAMGLKIENSNGTNVSNVVVDSDTTNIYLSTANNTTFEGVLKTGNGASANCDVITTTGSNISEGALNACVVGTPSFTLKTNVDMASTFKGNVSSDAENSHSSSILAPGFLAVGSISDWFAFENIWRSWARYSGTAVNDYTDITTRSYCNGNCVLRDWRLARADTGDAGASVASDQNSCPTSESFVTHTLYSGATIRFLRDAIEISEDRIGDDNLLCESGETCVFMPHIGGYQGTGDYVDSHCSNLDGSGTIGNVTFKDYAEMLP